ncbi:MAG: glycosyltransferase N-terminal domain-containing protein, partial [Pseudomonadota bacterium]
MARSFSLADYLNAPRKTRADEPAYAVRPDGPLIWAHATDRAHAGALRQLADRLRAHVPDLSLLLTNRDDLQPDATDRGPHEIAVPVPDNTADAAEIFLEHWSPDFAIWTTGALRPALIDCASRKDIPLALVDADEAMLTRPGWRWLPDFQSKVFDKFDFILTRDMQTHRYLERLSLKTVDVQMGGRLFDGAIHLPHNESDREELATLLLGRPVWLAAHVTAGETPVALEAHRDITRFAHRALVIVSPANEPEAERCLTAIRASGFHHLRWSDGDLPDEATQVILADVPGELG